MSRIYALGMSTGRDRTLNYSEREEARADADAEGRDGLFVCVGQRSVEW